MKKYLPFVVFWVIDSALLYLANMLYPSYYVLGNGSLNAWQAAVIAGLAWTFLIYNAMPLAKVVGIKEDNKLMMPIFYLVANFFALWVVARLSAVFGFGVINYVWVAYLAFIANIIQYAGWAISGPKR